MNLLKKPYYFLVLVAMAPLLHAQTPAANSAAPAAAPPAPLTNDQSSYLFGVNFGEQMGRMGIGDKISPEAVNRGLKDGLHGKKMAPTDQQQLQSFVKTAMEDGVKHNKAAAVEFLAHNAKEKGIQTTASGLQYKVINAGDEKAASPKPTDEVSVNYRGKLIDGSEFDSSFKSATPVSFPVNGVIKGWQEALVLMKPGAKWKLYIPPELAYDNSPKPGIPGGSLLIFDVDLLSVKAPAAAPNATMPVVPKQPMGNKQPQ